MGYGFRLMASDSNTTTVSFKIRVLGNECGALYFLFINTLLENEIKLLTSQELRAEIQAEIEKCLRQLELLKYELKAISGGIANG